MYGSSMCYEYLYDLVYFIEYTLQSTYYDISIYYVYIYYVYGIESSIYYVYMCISILHRLYYVYTMIVLYILYIVYAIYIVVYYIEDILQSMCDDSSIHWKEK